jgi:hypothetical protein
MERKNFIEEIYEFFEKYEKAIFYLALSTCIIFSLFLFNVKISESSDDSGYILGAWKFLKGELFPVWHGTLYQIVLSFTMWIFGLNIILLKSLSLLFIVIYIFLFFKTFRNRLPSYIVLLTISFVSVNAGILIYASLTYSETFFLLLQTLCIYFIFTITDKLEQNIEDKKLWKELVLLGFIMFVIINTKTIGFSMILSVLIVFIAFKHWQASLYATISFMFFQILFVLYKTFYWNYSKIGLEDQFNQITLTNPYNTLEGKESIIGYFARFFENSNQYSSQHILSYFGIHVHLGTAASITITVLVSVILFIALWNYRKDKYMFFIGIYLCIALAMTFVSLQVIWNQARLVMIYIPLLVIFLLASLHKAVIRSKIKFSKLLPLFVISLFIILNLSYSIAEIKKNLPVLYRNLKGDKLYGFSNDWINYIELCEWSAINLDKDAKIGCRFPTISFIYGNGKEFIGIYQFPRVKVEDFLLVAKNIPSFELIRLDEISYKLSKSEQTEFRSNLRAILIRSKKVLGIIDVNDSNKIRISNLISSYNLLHTNNYDSLVSLSMKKNSYIIYPDSLLNTLRGLKLNYVIDASIRSGVVENNKMLTLNAVQFNILFINEKYPGLFTEIKQFGKEEPAFLYKMN